MSKKLIGRVGVDSTLLMIGDPLYLLDSNHKSVGKSFSELEKKLKKDKNFKTEQNHKLLFNNGNDGLGLVIDTTNDGIYPVYLETDEKTGFQNIIISLNNL